MVKEKNITVTRQETSASQGRRAPAKDINGSGMAEAERRACYVENLLRVENDIPLREYYSKNISDYPLLNKDCNESFYNFNYKTDKQIPFSYPKMTPNTNPLFPMKSKPIIIR